MPFIFELTAVFFKSIGRAIFYIINLLLPKKYNIELPDFLEYEDKDITLGDDFDGIKEPKLSYYKFIYFYLIYYLFIFTLIYMISCNDNIKLFHMLNSGDTTNLSTILYTYLKKALLSIIILSVIMYLIINLHFKNIKNFVNFIENNKIYIILPIVFSVLAPWFK